MAINETLKFSWGHIIAFLAMIFISYLSFMGLTYLTDGNFMIAGIGVAVIDILLLCFFIGVQVIKSVEKKFAKRIIWERILLCLTPFVMYICLLPQNHFWTVYEQRQEIEQQFSNSIKQAKEMFDSYESYATKRIANYEKVLSKKKVKGVSKANKIEALTLQIKSDNYSNLKKSATEWINKATGATVWNVFMLANIKTINEAVGEWNHQLSLMSENNMSDELSDKSVKDKIPAFDSDSEVVSAVKSGLDSLKSIYTARGATQPYCWLILLLCYLMLISPYLIQRRNTKSLYTLLGNKTSESKIDKIQRQLNAKKKDSLMAKDEENLFVEQTDNKPIGNSDEYGSFTL